MSREERRVVVFLHRVAAKERRLDQRLRATASLARERNAAVAAERRTRKTIADLREYFLARGLETTFSDVMDGLTLAEHGRAIPPYWCLAIENAKRRRRVPAGEGTP